MDNIFSEQLKTELFHCPHCQKLVSELVDTCPNCSTAISNETKRKILKNEKISRINKDLTTQKTIILVSFLVFLLGLVMLGSMIWEIRNSNIVNFNCLMPFLVIGGAVMSIKGFLKFKELTREKMKM